MNILGISCFYHDSAAALVRDGKIIAAAQEERFTRKKHDDNFPKHAVEFCLKTAGIDMSQIDVVAFYEKPLVKFERLLRTYFAYAPIGFNSFIKAMPQWIRKKLWMQELLMEELPGFKGKIIYPEHHESHAAAAFFPSPFQDAAFLTIDGVGEWTTTSFGTGRGNKIQIDYEIHFPHSLGLLYSAFTYYTGFKVNSGEYKVMGLAPYGEPKYVDLIYKHLIDLKEDGSFRMNMDYFDFAAGLTMTNAKFDAIFGGPPRKPESRLGQREMDLAKSVQVVTEEIMMRMAKHVRKITGQKNLCLAGGVALNCVANGKLLKERVFENIWIQPAAGDAGSALGAALFGWYQYANNPRNADNINDTQFASYLGPDFTDAEIEAYLKSHDIPYKKHDRSAMVQSVAGILADEKVVGWFQNRMEFGPRALGSRSIIGDARSTKMQSVMNLKIKYRESFRPFAPSVLREKMTDYFDVDYDSKYMLLVADVKDERRIAMTEEQKKLFGIDKLNVPRSDVPAITHVDYSARIQTVHQNDHGVYYELIKAFYDKTGCPVIVNTSFNVRGEPIVCTPEDAFRCFMRTEMDYLVLGNFVLDKKEQKPVQDNKDWMNEFELD
ncbi:MAG TPA: carbamoyltransferase [bacterium]|nr:carbamoyltransferase [bacterium]